MKYTPAAALLLIVVAFSFAKCDHKKDPPEPPVPVETATDTAAVSKNLLSKTVLTTTAGTISMEYQYDAQNKLIGYTNSSSKPDYFEDTSKIVRDGSGIIKRVVYRSDTSRKFPDPKLDSVVYSVFNNGAKYTYKILAYKSFAKPFRDSTVYTYDDAKGLIIKEETYYFDYIADRIYKQAQTTTYTYDAAGNMATASTIYYKVDNANDFPFQITYTYHDKGVNLLNLGNDGIVIGMKPGIQQNFSGAAIKTMKATYPQSATDNRDYTIFYTFNTKYRPLKADISDAVTGTKGTIVYTYQ